MKNNNNKNPSTPSAFHACPAPNITHLRDYTIHSLKDICRWAYDRLAHQPRCQDIMANLLGVCRGSEGRGEAFV